MLESGLHSGPIKLVSKSGTWISVILKAPQAIFLHNYIENQWLRGTPSPGRKGDGRLGEAPSLAAGPGGPLWEGVKEEAETRSLRKHDFPVARAQELQLASKQRGRQWLGSRGQGVQP